MENRGMWYICLCMTACMTVQAIDYKTQQDALQAIMSAHVKAFAVENLVSSGIPQGGDVDWNNALNGVEGWINKLLDKKRSALSDISKKNRDIIKKALSDIRAATLDLVTTLRALRTANFNFEPSRYSDIDLDAVKLQVQQLVKRADALKALQKSLEIGILDVQDTKDIKNVLKAEALALEQTFIKVGNDLDKLRAPIRLEIDRKKYGK